MTTNPATRNIYRTPPRPTQNSFARQAAQQSFPPPNTTAAEVNSLNERIANLEAEKAKWESNAQKALKTLQQVVRENQDLKKQLESEKAARTKANTVARNMYNRVMGLQKWFRAARQRTQANGTQQVPEVLNVGSQQDLQQLADTQQERQQQTEPIVIPDSPTAEAAPAIPAAPAQTPRPRREAKPWMVSGATVGLRHALDPLKTITPTEILERQVARDQKEKRKMLARGPVEPPQLKGIVAPGVKPKAKRQHKQKTVASGEGQARKRQTKRKAVDTEVDQPAKRQKKDEGGVQEATGAEDEDAAFFEAMLTEESDKEASTTSSTGVSDDEVAAFEAMLSEDADVEDNVDGSSTRQTDASDEDIALPETMMSEAEALAQYESEEESEEE
jgi:hypothetical protein